MKTVRAQHPTLRHAGMLALAFMLFALPADAFLGRGKKDKEAESVQQGPRMAQKYLLHIPNKKTEQELKDLTSTKKLLTADLQALERLEEARSAQALRIQNTLSKEFNIQPDKEYGFDRDTGALYELEPSDDGISRTEIKVLDAQTAGRRLQSMLQERARLAQQIQVLRAIQGEQKAREAQVDGLLSNKFSMKPGRLYHYDEKAMILYEVVPAPDSAGGDSGRARAK